MATGFEKLGYDRMYEIRGMKIYINSATWSKEKDSQLFEKCKIRAIQSADNFYLYDPKHLHVMPGLHGLKELYVRDSTPIEDWEISEILKFESEYFCLNLSNIYGDYRLPSRLIRKVDVLILPLKGDATFNFNFPRETREIYVADWFFGSQSFSNCWDKPYHWQNIDTVECYMDFGNKQCRIPFHSRKYAEFLRRETAYPFFRFANIVGALYESY